MPRTHVLLDLDGTLSHSEPGILRSLQWAFEQEGFPVPTEAEVRSVIGPPLEIGLPSIGIPDDALERVINTYRSRYETTGAFENTDAVVEDRSRPAFSVDIGRPTVDEHAPGRDCLTSRMQHTLDVTDQG